MTEKQNNKIVRQVISCCLLLYGFFAMSLLHAEEIQEASPDKVYPDKFKILFGAYFIEDTNTKVAINSSVGNIGTSIDLERDLGTDGRLSVPRIDGYYRFNNKHRIEFGWFKVDRKGTKTTTLEIKVGDEIYSANSVIDTKIDTNFLKLAYAYSFYKSPKVELSLIAGLNLLDYSLSVNNRTSGRTEAADVTAPLPVFGLRMDYVITPRWLVHYKFQTLYIELDDNLSGSLVDAELGVEYRWFKNIGIGLGFNHFALDATVKSSSYNGAISDLYRGANLYVSAYF